MTQREKILAAIVVASVVIAILFYGANSVQAVFRSKDREIRSLRSSIDDVAKEVAKGREAKQRILWYHRRSLPSDTAKGIYGVWLRQTVEDCNIRDWTVKPTQTRTLGNRDFEYDAARFNVNGSGTLEELTEFLYEFYSVDMLHYVSNLTITPNEDDNVLRLAISIETLFPRGITDTPQPESDQRKWARLGNRTLNDYLVSIAGRDVFSPPNNAPRIPDIRRQEVEIGDRFTMRIDATDEDGDPIEYDVEGPMPQGLQLDSRSGEISWSPEEEELVEVTVIAREALPWGKGLESKRTITLQSLEPRPERLDFDEAEHTYVSGITIDTRGRLRLWISNRVTAQQWRVAEGETFEVGSFQATVKEIRDATRTAILESPDGRLSVRIGVALAEAEYIDAAGEKDETKRVTLNKTAG